jgi:hypothetical protein
LSIGERSGIERVDGVAWRRFAEQISRKFRVVAVA